MQSQQDNSFSSQQSPKDESVDDVSTVQNLRVDLQIDLNRKRYGNMVVFTQKPFLITLGPDCNYLLDLDMCFICGFGFFVGLGYFLCYVVSLAFENKWVIYSTYFLSILQCVSYFLVAISDPSIATNQENPIPIDEVTKKNQHLTCRECGAESGGRTYHCRDCDVCVRGYDHHCPWTSKCIGQGNLKRFYVFVSVTPIYILSFIGLMFGCLILSAQKANHNLRESAMKSLL